LLDPSCVLPEEDLSLIRDVVRQAGAIAKSAFDANNSKQWNKADSSPVTEADIAVNDGGAKLNGEALKVTDPAKIAGIHMIGYPRKFRRLDFPDMSVTVANSMAYRMCLVASGAADATIAFTPKSDWDVASCTLC